MITVYKSAFSLEFFMNEEQKANALALQPEISCIDEKIDQLVYKPDGLTEEEISIVEGGEK